MRLLPSLFGMVASACLGAPGPGYLARLGPNPIRFQPAMQASLTRVSLPPLQIREVQAVRTTNSEPDQVAAGGNPNSSGLAALSRTMATNQVASPTNQPAITANLNPLLSPLEANAPAEAMPQLLHYFNQMPTPQGGAATGTVLPISFVPAIPNNPPPSSATYSSPSAPAKSSP